MHQYVTQFPYTYIQFHCHLRKQTRLEFKYIHYNFRAHSTQYAILIHRKSTWNIVIKRVHYDPRIQGHLMTSPKCVHHVHVTQTTGYHTVLTSLRQICHIYSENTYIVFKASILFIFLMCTNSRKILCFHSR